MSDLAYTARCEKWEEMLLQAQRKVWKEYDLEKPTSLYHYSTMDGVRGILQSGEFWLSDVLAMKDSVDGRYWLDVFRSIINRKSVPGHVKTLFNSTDDFGLGEAWHQYIACFSVSSTLDDQWRDYADNSRGCALEVSYAVLAEGAADGARYAYCPMLYDEQKQRAYAERLIDAAIHLARDVGMTSSESRRYWHQCALPALLICGTRYKKPDYEREHEWRFFVAEPDSARVRFRPDTGARYVALTIPEGAIVSIVRGRSCSCSVEELRELLIVGGYPPTVV